MDTRAPPRRLFHEGRSADVLHLCRRRMGIAYSIAHKTESRGQRLQAQCPACPVLSCPQVLATASPQQQRSLTRQQNIVLPPGTPASQRTASAARNVRATLRARGYTYKHYACPRTRSAAQAQKEHRECCAPVQGFLALHPVLRRAHHVTSCACPVWAARPRPAPA